MTNQKIPTPTYKNDHDIQLIHWTKQNDENKRFS